MRGAFIAAGKEPLLDTRLLKIPPMRAGLVTYLCQQFIIMGTFFVLPLYLQTVLGYDALQTGIVLLPLSLSLARLCARRRRGWPDATHPSASPPPVCSACSAG